MLLGIGGNVLRISGGAFLGDALEITALAKCFHRILRQALGIAPFVDCWPDVGRECVLQQRLGLYQVAILLRGREFSAVDQCGLGEEFLRDGDGLDHGFDFALEVMTLIDHVCDVGLLACLPFEAANLVEDAEDLIGIDGAKGQIVVSITAIVKVK
jgi:hypothetical protein